MLTVNLQVGSYESRIFANTLHTGARACRHAVILSKRGAAQDLVVAVLGTCLRKTLSFGASSLGISEGSGTFIQKRKGL
jgi:hypothetical protein